MKVWKVNDYEWWAGPDVESVKAACEAAWGPASDGDPYWDEIYPEEVSAEGMRENKLEISMGLELTYAEFLEDLTRAHPHDFPCFFCAADA